MEDLKARKRVLLPLAGAALCLVAMIPAGPILTWVLLFATLGLLLDAITMAWPRTGNATHHRQ